MKKFILYLITVIISIQFTGCIIDEMTRHNAYLINNSFQKITVLCYKNGVVLPEDTIRINHGDSFLFGYGNDFGDIREPGFSSEYGGGIDDHRDVLYNDEYKVSHYLNKVIDSSGKYYLITHDRNINNPNNYEFEMIRTKKERINNHYYTFTEADYEFAKE